MTIYFHKTTELNGSNSVKSALTSSAILKTENYDEYFFLSSILASVCPYKCSFSNRVSNYRQYFDELNLDGFDFTNGFKFSYVHKIENLKNLSINIFDLYFYQD